MGSEGSLRGQLMQDAPSSEETRCLPRPSSSASIWSPGHGAGPDAPP
ncbi:hypothetical protein SLNWT_1382 [Streptomyces albus]|uniref:Uncharacterized protein n=1 Tax=Streptomyces albus (strain ATCC 21838 / DSM 41398 / FERM P-419 / JCM 4703 / NBRC 107858) TaxID=1081613 RepID=A0A0B5EHT5_STRA4|nr:hypothetical protein SLNWT_1382 [Streptomyces albus]AOU76075.1 hypothetical protein SLNHY_1384 [Streptomyces albus]